jgi:hypothetical protein
VLVRQRHYPQYRARIGVVDLMLRHYRFQVCIRVMQPAEPPLPFLIHAEQMLLTNQ